MPAITMGGSPEVLQAQYKPRKKTPFNVLLPKSGFDRYTLETLRFLDYSASVSFVDVVVYIIDNSDIPVPDDWNNIDVVQLVETTTATGPFKRGVLLNLGLEKMRQPEGVIVTICDADMLVSPAFFTTLVTAVTENSHTISQGKALTADSLDYIFAEKRTWSQVLALDTDKRFRVGLSNFSVKLSYLQELLRYFGLSQLYDTTFEGWGGEDTLVTDYFRIMERKGLGCLNYVPEMFRHLWHPRSQNPNYDNNLYYLNEQRKELKAKYGTYL